SARRSRRLHDLNLGTEQPLLLWRGPLNRVSCDCFARLFTFGSPTSNQSLVPSQTQPPPTKAELPKSTASRSTSVVEANLGQLLRKLNRLWLDAELIASKPPDSSRFNDLSSKLI